jgi:hypothetical protein
MEMRLLKIDQLLKDTDWRVTDGISVRCEYPLDNGGRVVVGRRKLLVEMAGCNTMHQS